MNIALKKPDGREYYLAVIRRLNGHYSAQGKCVLRDGKLRTFGRPFECESLGSAQRRCRQLAKLKMKRRGYKQIRLDQLPESVIPFLEPPPEMRLTQEELIELVKDTKRERYVVFEDTAGLEGYFDKGVEYLGHETKEEGVLQVYDKFGELRHVFRERLASVEPTERCLELRKLNVRPQGKSD